MDLNSSFFWIFELIFGWIIEGTVFYLGFSIIFFSYLCSSIGLINGWRAFWGCLEKGFEIYYFEAIVLGSALFASITLLSFLEIGFEEAILLYWIFEDSTFLLKFSADLTLFNPCLWIGTDFYTLLWGVLIFICT